MSAGFTSGPWVVRPSDSEHYALISANPGFGGEEKNGGIYVAKVQGPDRASNANLIAAAPSLYADAEFLCARIRELEGEMRDDDDLSRQYFGHVLPAVARMESGLAEARGQQVSE